MIIEVNDLVKNFNSKPVLNKINFNVNEGEIFSLIGPNGAGKTTT
jgi:ABC-type Mn/Zn transport systems, ATPase component